MISLTRAFPVLAVTDLDIALAFYTERLGFALDWREDRIIAAVGNGVVTLFLKSKEAGGLGPVSVIVNVEDADAVYAAWTAADVEITDPIATRTWGMREFTARDLDGNELTVGHVDESIADYSAYTSGADGEPIEDRSEG
ncbi:MAG: VOC family protein [Alphaproteobacteria bacterium]|nr:VOC family protein [Alphaproteobacteria bacterium]